MPPERSRPARPTPVLPPRLLLFLLCASVRAAVEQILKETLGVGAVDAGRRPDWIAGKGFQAKCYPLRL